MKRGMLRFSAAGVAVASVLAVSEPARAQSRPIANGQAVISRACASNQGPDLTEGMLAEALLIESGESILRFLGDADAASRRETSGSSGGTAALLDRMREIRASHAPANVAEGIENLEQVLNAGPGGVTVERLGSSQKVQIFTGAGQDWRVTCKPPSPDAREADPPPPPRLALREKPEELWLAGEEARKAGAVNLGYSRTRSLLDDGSHKTDTNFSIKGTAGLRLTGPHSRVGHAYLFGNYELERARTRPRPKLAPGAKEGDGDTNALALGVNAILQPYVSAHRVVDVNLESAVLFDFANDASRLRFRVIATPRPDWNLGLCYVGSFSDGPLRGRCEIAGEVQVAHVLRRGTTQLGAHDNFAAAGGRAGIEFFIPTAGADSPDTGFLASVRYRYLHVLHGPADDIKRVEAKLAHRFWTGGNAGFDVGFTYTKGTNELSFEKEDVLTLGAGFLF